MLLAAAAGLATGWKLPKYPGPSIAAEFRYGKLGFGSNHGDFQWPERSKSKGRLVDGK